MKSRMVSSKAIVAVRMACNLRRLAVWRKTKIAESNIVSIGSRQVESTSKPGVVTGRREEKTDKMIAMAEPAPTIAATSEEIRTSFRRI